MESALLLTRRLQVAQQVHKLLRTFARDGQVEKTRWVGICG